MFHKSVNFPKNKTKSNNKRLFWWNVENIKTTWIFIQMYAVIRVCCVYVITRGIMIDIFCCTTLWQYPGSVILKVNKNANPAGSMPHLKLMRNRLVHYCYGFSQIMFSFFPNVSKDLKARFQKFKPEIANVCCIHF